MRGAAHLFGVSLGATQNERLIRVRYSTFPPPPFSFQYNTTACVCLVRMKVFLRANEEAVRVFTVAQALKKRAVFKRDAPKQQCPRLSRHRSENRRH